MKSIQRHEPKAIVWDRHFDITIYLTFSRTTINTHTVIPQVEFGKEG